MFQIGCLDKGSPLDFKREKGPPDDDPGGSPSVFSNLRDSERCRLIFRATFQVDWQFGGWRRGQTHCCPDGTLHGTCLPLHFSSGQVRSLEGDRHRGLVRGGVLSKTRISSGALGTLQTLA